MKATKSIAARTARKDAPKAQAEGRKPSKRIARLAEALNTGAALSASERKELEKWARDRMNPEAKRAALLISLGIAGCDVSLVRPTPPAPQIPEDQERAVIAKRFDYAGEVLADFEPKAHKLAGGFGAIVTLAEEYEFLDDDGPGLQAKQHAILCAVINIAKAGRVEAANLGEAASALGRKMDDTVTPEDVAALEGEQTPKDGKALAREYLSAPETHYALATRIEMAAAQGFDAILAMADELHNALEGGEQ